LNASIQWFLIGKDMPPFLFFVEGEEFLIRKLKQDVHCRACYTMCLLPPLPLLFDYIPIHVAKPKHLFEFMHLMNDYLLPLPQLHLILNCIHLQEVLLELMNNDLWLGFYSVRTNIQKVNGQLLKHLLVQVP
jgi:hypothetical protein